MDENKGGDEKPAIREVELSGKDAREKLAELLGGMSVNQGNKTSTKSQQDYKFWSTQPVPSIDSQKERELLDGEAIEEKTLNDVPKEPYKLIDAFEWSQIDVTDDSQLEEAYILLNENYVEDVHAMFRFDYSRDFLRWALMPPGWQPSWHIGVRVKANKKLVAFITAIPATIVIHGKSIDMVEINFLCVHKKLRSKRLAPVLIREITRLVNLKNIWQAVYTAGAILPCPVSSSRYYHRSLNPKKLIDVGFSRLQPRMTMTRTLKLYSLQKESLVPGLRELRASDVAEVCALIRSYNQQFSLYVDMNEDDVSHWLLPRPGVIYSYVVADDEGKLTDLISFYSLPSSVMKHPVHSKLQAAYSYCNVTSKTPLLDLMRSALILAHKNGFDVFNALELGNNGEFFKPLKFSIGDGSLNYYLYNWKCRSLDSSKNALVLL